MYENLIKLLRHCATESSSCDLCAMDNKCPRHEKLLSEAADAIEALQQEAAHYEQESKDWYAEACEYRTALAYWQPLTESKEEA